MSEPQARSSAPRGRGSGRGGRGGYGSSRGGRPKQSPGETSDTSVPAPSYDDQGEIGQLKKKHALNIMTIKEMFPQFTEDDIVFALEETNGDMERTVERMTEGNVSQWGEVKKKTKDRVPSKATKDMGTDSAEGFSRGGRTRGDGTRGGRARGTERGRGRGRARDQVTSRKPVEATTETTTTTNDGWDAPVESHAAVDGSDQPTTTTSEDSGWDVVNAAEAEPAAPPPAPVEQSQTSSKPDGTRTWASMFAQKPKPKAVVATPKPPTKTQPVEAPVPAAVPIEAESPTTREEPPIEDAAVTLPTATSEAEPAVEITPSEDQLTESNLQQVPGSPQEPATATVVSNAGTNEPRIASGIATPLQGATPSQQTVRPGLGGFQTSALKATTPTPRTSSYARRVNQQQEAVVMPGNHAVDRTAVQFGSLGLGSSSADLDADDDREQPETRAQPPQHSPVAPKASLPSTSQPTETTKPAPGLSAAGSQQTTSQEQQSTQTAGQTPYQYNQFGSNYGYSGQPSDASAQKGYEPFGQQTAQAGSLNGYPSHTQAPGQPAQATQPSQFGGFGSGNNDYSSYYSSEQQRNAYGMYGSYGQSQAPSDSAQKNATAFGGLTSASELPATTATSQAAHPNQTRFGGIDQNSGHSTPNPQSASQPHTQGQQAQPVGQNNQQSGYPYGSNPYYNNYYPSYMNQHNYGRDRPPFDDVRRYEEQFMGHSQHYGYGANQGGYGGAPYGGGKYGQPHQGYGIPSQSWDGHAGSPANSGSYGQQPGTGRDTATHGNYGRTSSTQPSEAQQTSNTYGSTPDVFGRSGSTYGAQGSYQQTQQSSDDTTRGYGDSKATGPSPAPGQNAGRPASAVNSQAQGSQTQHQQGYGGYPGQQSHYGSGYGHQGTTQAHQTGGYNAYAGFGGNNYYSGNSSRGNWGGSYGQGH